MKAIPAIKQFFDNPKPTMDELKNLSFDERQELGQLCAEALGEDFEPSDPS